MIVKGKLIAKQWIVKILYDNFPSATYLNNRYMYIYVTNSEVYKYTDLFYDNRNWEGQWQFFVRTQASSAAKISQIRIVERIRWKKAKIKNSLIEYKALNVV